MVMVVMMMVGRWGALDEEVKCQKWREDSKLPPTQNVLSACQHRNPANERGQKTFGTYFVDVALLLVGYGSLHP